MLSWLISALILAIFLYGVIAFWRRYRQPRTDERSIPMKFILLAGVLSLGITWGFLAYRSVLMELDGFAGGWVHVMELRYYAPILPFLMIGLVLAAFRVGWRGLRYPALALLLVSAVFIGAWHIRTTASLLIDHHQPLGIQLYDGHPVIQSIQRAKQSAGGNPLRVVYESVDREIMVHAMAEGIPRAALNGFSPQTRLHASSPVTVLVLRRSTDEYLRPAVHQVMTNTYHAEVISGDPFFAYLLHLGGASHVQK